MGKFGKKNEINLNPLAYNIALGGEAGIGKSTLIKEVCEKLVGEDGYLSLDVGREDGHKAISGIITESVPDWATYMEVIDDIVENKESDYPNLKVVVIDTYDQLCSIAEKEAIRLYNKKMMAAEKPKVDTINAAWGSYGRGLEKTIELMLDSLWKLKSVGISFILIFHVKKTNMTDVITDEQYSILTSDTTQKYFNAVKTKLDFLGMAYLDRDIIKVKTGRKDSKGKEIEKGKLAGESRVISFRDDTYSVDSKCRFANIVDRIPFDSDEFIKAMQDAILAEQSKDGISLSDAKKKQDKAAKDAKKEASENSRKAKEDKIDEDLNAELVETITVLFKGCSDKEKKTEFKALLKELAPEASSLESLAEMPTKIVQKLADFWN